MRRISSKFVYKEINALLERDPPYTEKFMSRVFMCLKQVTKVLEAQEITIENMKTEIQRLGNNDTRGPKRQTDRNEKIVREFKKGATCVELGRQYRISSQRIHAIVKMAKAKGVY